MNLKTLIVIVLSVAGLLSCSVGGYHGNGDDNYWSDFRAFDIRGWDYASVQTFTVDTLRDSSATGLLALSVRHTHGYEYANLWLEFQSLEGDSVVRRDSINVVLADDFGRWAGRGSGLSFQVTDTLPGLFTLRRGQRFGLRHIMRKDTICDIEQIGLVFYPAK